MVSCKPISFTKNIALKKRESLDAVKAMMGVTCRAYSICYGFWGRMKSEITSGGGMRGWLKWTFMGCELEFQYIDTKHLTRVESIHASEFYSNVLQQTFCENVDTIN